MGGINVQVVIKYYRFVLCTMNRDPLYHCLILWEQIKLHLPLMILSDYFLMCENCPCSNKLCPQFIHKQISTVYEESFVLER